MSRVGKCWTGVGGLGGDEGVQVDCSVALGVSSGFIILAAALAGAGCAISDDSDAVVENELYSIEG